MTKVILALDTELQAYIRKIFETPKGPVKIRRVHAIGLFINSMLRFSKKRPIRSYHKSIIELKIPESKNMDQEYYYAYFSAEDEKKINDFIRAHFQLRIELFFVQGYRAGFLQKDIVNSLIFYFGLTNDSATFERIKKRDFRKRQSINNIMTEMMEKYL